MISLILKFLGFLVVMLITFGITVLFIVIFGIVYGVLTKGVV